MLASMSSREMPPSLQVRNFSAIHAASPARRIGKAVGERLRLGALDRLVAGLFPQPMPEMAQVFGFLRRGSGNLRIATHGEQIQMQPEHALRILRRDARADESAPVAALHADALATERA